MIGIFAFLCVSAATPIEWSFQVDSPAVKIVSIAPDIILTYYEVEAGFLNLLLNFFFFIVEIYILANVIRYYLQQRHKARLFLAAFLIYFFCGINDILILMRVYSGIYLVECRIRISQAHLFDDFFPSRFHRKHPQALAW